MFIYDIMIMLFLVSKALEVLNEVNLWAEKETNGLIKELLPLGSVDDETALIFANALYYKGEWKAIFSHSIFDSSFIQEFDFRLLDGTSVQVPFMTSNIMMQFIATFDGFKVLKLSYKQGEDNRQFSMCFFLPDEKDGLQNLLEKMGSDPGFIDCLIPHRISYLRKFRIPRLKILYQFETAKELKEMGHSFRRNLRIYHKSVIEVNEQGPEAAAARTAVKGFGSGGSLPKTIDFVADHPFLFVIREDTTGVVLFMGHEVNPLGATNKV